MVGREEESTWTPPNAYKESSWVHQSNLDLVWLLLLYSLYNGDDHYQSFTAHTSWYLKHVGMSTFTIPSLIAHLYHNYIHVQYINLHTQYQEYIIRTLDSTYMPLTFFVSSSSSLMVSHPDTETAASGLDQG